MGSSSEGSSSGGKPSPAKPQGAETELANPFKKAVAEKAKEALRELYGDDYEEPIGFEEAKTSEQQMKLKDKLTAKLGQWFNSAKGKYAEELQNPDSKVNQVKKKLASLNEDLMVGSLQQTEAIMVSMGVDEPLEETEFGMANPYRQDLSQFLAAETEKEQAEREAEQRERELQEAADREQDLLDQAQERVESLELAEAVQEGQGEFKFTIDADEDEDVDVIATGDDAQNAVETEVAGEQFVDSDEDEEEEKEKELASQQIEEEKAEGQIVEEVKGAPEESQQSETDPNNPYAKVNQKLNKKDLVWLEDFTLQHTKKEVKRPGLFKSIVSNIKEERLLTIRDGILFSIKRVPSQNAASKSLGRFFAAKLPDNNQEALSQGDRGVIKSRSEMTRLYKVDVVGKGRNILNGMQTELELILHFVNKARDPMGKAELKRYTLRQDEHTRVFLATLQAEAMQKSVYYNK